MKFQNILITVLIVASIHSTALSMEQKSQQKGKQSGKNPKKSQRKKTSEDDELKMLEAAQEQNLQALIQRIVDGLNIIRFSLDFVAETYQHRVSEDGKIIMPILFSPAHPNDSIINMPTQLHRELKKFATQIGTTQATMNDLQWVIVMHNLVRPLLQEEVSRRGKDFSSPQEEIKFVESKLPLVGKITPHGIKYRIAKEYKKEEFDLVTKIVEETLSYHDKLLEQHLPHFKYERFKATPTLVSFFLKWDSFNLNTKIEKIPMLLFKEYKNASPEEKQYFGIILNMYASIAIDRFTNSVNTDREAALQYPSKLLRKYNDFLQKTDAAIKPILAMIEKQSASFIFDFLDYKPQSEETKKTIKSIDQALKMGTSILAQAAKKSIPTPEKKKPVQKPTPISAASAGKEEEEEPAVITEEKTVPTEIYLEEEIPQIRPRTMKVTLPSLAKITYAPRVEKWFDPQMLETATRSSLLYHRFPKEMDRYLLEYGARKVFRRVKGKPEMQHSLVGEIDFDNGTNRYVQYHLTMNDKHEIYHRGIEPRRLEDIRKLDELIKQRAEGDMPVLEYITAQPPQKANDMPDGVIEDNRFYVNIRDNTLGANFIAYKTVGFES